MSAAREGRAPMHNFRRVGQQQQTSLHQLNRNRLAAPAPSNRPPAAYTENGLYTELMGNLSITEEEQSFSDDSADFNHHSYSSRRHDEQQQQQQPQLQFERRERRGSYGNLSDNGDGGVFHFEES